MTDDELAALRAQWRTYAGPLEPVIQQMRLLLNEVDRWREIGRAVVTAHAVKTQTWDGTPAGCVVVLDDSEVIDKARDLLAGD